MKVSKDEKLLDLVLISYKCNCCVLLHNSHYIFVLQDYFAVPSFQCVNPCNSSFCRHSSASRDPFVVSGASAINIERWRSA